MTSSLLELDFEQIRKHQMNDRIISKVIAEMEIVPRDKQFSGQLWNMSEFKRFKQIQSQLFLVNRVLVRNFKDSHFRIFKCGSYS